MATLKELYTALKSDGAPLPDTYEKFEKYMTSGPQGGYAHRKEVYDALKNDGAPLPDTYEDFSRALFVRPAAAVPGTAHAAKPAGASRAQGSDANAAAALTQSESGVSGAAAGSVPASTQAPTAPAEARPGRAEDRTSEKKSGVFVRMDSADRTPIQSAYRVMDDPEDIYKVTGLVNREGTSKEPFTLQEVVATPSGAMSVAQYEDEQRQKAYEKELEGLWGRQDSKGGNAAEQAWAAAEQRQREAMEKNAREVYKGTGDAMGNAAKLGGRENHIMNAADYSHRNMTAHMSNFDLDRMMNEAWANLGEKGQRALVDDCYQMLRRRYPKDDKLTIYNRAVALAREQSDRRLYELAVAKNMPEGNLQYLMRKIGDMNTLMAVSRGLAVSSAGGKTGDMSAYEEAGERYRKDGHRVLDAVGTVAGFAADPTTYLSMGAGSGAAKATMWAMGKKLAGKGASKAVRKAAEREFTSTLTGRVFGSMAGGAGNFAFLEGAKEAEGQYSHGGYVTGKDETGRYVREGYSPMAVAGAAAHGGVMGGAIGWISPVSGNVSDALVRGTASTAGKVATRAGVGAGALLAEGTVFSLPEWIEGERDGFDVWLDNMVMVGAFHGKKVVKSATGMLGDLKASFDSPTNGQKNRLDFESRLRQRMDAPSDGGMALTRGEREELERKGYGDLAELVTSHEEAKGMPAVQGDKATQIASRLTDMVKDADVSEAARAKMYYYATGRKLPMSTVMRGELIEDGDGGFIVESQGANGVITSRSFKSRKAADLELERIKRQAELNSIEIGERYQQTADFENRLQEACRTVAAENGWDMVEVYRTCEEARRNHLRGGDKEFDEAQQNILRKVTDAMGEFEETGVTDAMRGRINEKYGVDIDGAIRKEAYRRTQQEQTAIDEYIAELMPDKAKEPNPVEDAQAEDITNQKLLTDDEPAAPQVPAESEPIDPRFDNSAPSTDYDPHQPNTDLWPKGRAVMKFQDRPVEVLSGNVIMTEDGTMVDNERSDASIVIRDLSTGEIEMVSPEAILSYEEYPDTVTVEDTEGVQEGAAAPEPEAEPQSRYTSGQIKIRNSDGTETRGVLTGYVDENGNHEYYVEGDLQHLHYASEHELDNILSEYQPDEPQQPSAEQPQAAERVYPEGVTDTKAYHDGYANGTEWAKTLGDDEVESALAKALDSYNETTGRGESYDYALGTIDALQEELGRRLGEDTPPPSGEASEDSPQGEEDSVRDGSPSLHGGKYGRGEIIVREVDGSTKRGWLTGFLDEKGRHEYYVEGELDAPRYSTDGELDGILEGYKPEEASVQAPEAPENRENQENREEVEEAEEEAQPAAAPTAEPTPLQRIPRDAKGEPIFEQAENPEHGWDALVEFAEGDAATAKEIADTMAEEKRKAYEKAQKQKPKGKTPTEILASKKAISAGLAQAEQEYNLWQQMANVEQRRQDAIRAQQEAEARQRAAERAETEKAERESREEAARLEREALEGIPEWHLDTPENARKRGVRRFSGQMFTRQEPVQGVVGKEVEVKFSQKDLPQGHLAVIEAPQLQPSHIQGQRNPMFFIEEAQPKNRAEAVSMFAAKEMAEGIRPKEITGSATAYTGAPTVNTRGEVIQGNNRSDALRYLWENKLPEQQQTYKQYLIDNAEQFGLDPEAVNAMQQPVLVNMLDVDDAEAIRLGQMTAQDTESGGIERIKPKNVAQKLGEDMRSFASQLLRSGDEEASFSQLVDRNGTDVMKWMAQKGAITNTQYQSAFDSKGNLTAEAKNDMQKVLYQAVFKGGSQQLEEMFDALPAKAQRAILSTAFRDMDSPLAGRMLPEIQASIAAYHQLMNDSSFAAAKKMEEVLRAIEAFKQQILLDDRFEQYMPADNFSNFALHLAAMYKANDLSQTTIAGYFNQMYDLAQGKKAATLFEEADTTEYPLADVIKKVLNIDYKPAKNGNNNVADGGADVALRNQDGQGGELRGNEPPGGGEQTPAGTEPSDRGGGTSDDSRRGEIDTRGGESQEATQQERLSKEAATDIIASKTAIMKKLQGMERAYTKESLLPNSSEWHLAEHPTDVPDLLPTQGKSELSERKVTNSASDKQESGAESSVQPTDNKGEQTIQTAVEAASSEVNTEPTPAQVEAGNGYKVEPKPYTNKQGKTLDTYLVTFNRDFSKEELSALRAKAKAVKGWYDRESGGWMLRSVDDAKAFAEDVAGKSEDEVADEAPLSMADMEQTTEAPVKKVDVPGVFDALKTKGEAKLSDHAEPTEQPNPKKRRWISDEDADEFDSLRKDLRSHFGKDGDIVQEAGAEYGKPKPKQMDAEVLRMGTRMTYLMMKGGLRSFSDYCEAMKDELPDIFDEMRPHLKSLYAAAQNMEEVIELGWDEEMDDRKTVKAFDVYNFDKAGAKDIIATAQHAVDENASQQQTDQIIQTLKDQRNEQRKKEADETSADTETIIDKAETTASQVESKLEAANSEEDAEGLSRSLDKEIEEVNKQLALLGYYEADPVDKDFNEAYGYMRNAERKAVQDAHRLATQLASDLGITIDPKDKVRKAKYGFGSKIARSNVAPAGGEVYITLPLAEGRELSIRLSLDKNEPWRDGGREDRTNEDLMLTGIMYRVENTGAGGMDRYVSSNHNTRPTIPYDELLSDIRRLVRSYLPDETVKPATPLAPQPGEDMVDMAKRVASDKEPKAPAVEPQLPIGDLFGGLFDEQPQAPQPTAPTKKEISERKPKSEVSTSKPKSNEKTDVQPRTEGTGRGGQQPRPNEPLGEGAKHEDERTDGGRMAQRGGEHSVSDSGRGAGVSGQHQSERGVTAPRTPAAPKNTRNNHAERGMDYAPKGEKARIDANIAALELAKKLLASGATATPQEMAILRRYSGWGGLGAAFNEGSAWAPNPVNKRLREALTPEEYQAAVMSRNSAYYTPAAVIDAMWDVAKALGFKGGNIVEGSAGIGNIIGLMPTEISERSNIHAVEIDPTTGGILSLLYPDAKVEVQGFEQTRIANGSVDLAITNVPFVTDLHVMDESGDSDLSKKFRDIHDFCIAKNVRKLREGGIGIFITSSGTLDKSQKLRNWLVGDKEGNADVVGVFRMNNQTFGGTAATSDIIVVRKRVNGRKSANAIDVSTVTPARTATFTDARGKTKDLPLYVNRYFIEHPEHMGGEMFFGFEQGDTYRPTSIGLFPTRTADQTARMAAWVQHLADMDWSKEQGKAVAEQTSHINEALGEGVKEGSMVTDSEGNLCVARMGRAVPLALNKNKIKGRTKEECFKDYTEIKSALADVLKYQTEHDDDAGLQPLLDRLNRAYDTFVQRYGNLNKNKNLAWLRNDVDFSSIVALETYSEKGNKDGTKIKTYGKTDIFSRRVVEKESEPTPKNVKDGIIASIYKYGRIDTEYLATQLGKSQDDVKQEIVESGLGFVDPTTGQMEVSYEYLSGNVREKLRQAREANEAAGGVYDANIKALEAVVPMNIPAHLIEFALGSSWIEPQLYERYVKERTELDVKLTNAGGTWHMETPYWTGNEKNREMGVRSEKLNKLVEGHELIEAALTNKTIRVQKTTNKETLTDESATALCAAKVDEIRQDFKDWAREQMQNDPALSMRMEEKYNEKFNNSVPKSIPDEFVPEHFGGAATTVGGRPFKLRPHQAKAVIRATTQPVLLAHEVGTGKTYTLITTAMEMRRLGTARKPMIVVQNATVGQFVASAKALYPNAKVLTLEDADRNAEGRRAFYAKIKFNDWDMIVVPQSVFERIPDSIERQTQFIQDKIEEKMLVLEQMKEADPDGRSMIVRAAEREISRLEDEMSQLASGEEPTSGKKKKDAKKAAITRQNAEVKARELLDRATDDVEDFDSMGIDAILVDEAHEYKHLGFATAMQRGVKGVDPSPSKKSQGVFLKTQAVLEKTGGKNVVFATGTPISNTAAEIWTFMRYLIPADVMKEYDIFYFDDFVRNFGNIQQMLEFKTNGKYDEVNRFAGYFNLPELVRIWSTVADTVLTREAGGVSDKIPQMEGGKAQDIFLPQTRALRSIMKFVKDELKRYEDMTGKEKKENSHIPLVMYGIAKAAAVDARLVQSDAEDDPKSKTNEAVRQTLRSLEETKDYKGTVAIFADNYQNKSSGFNLYEDIRKKLIAAGVPEEQVVVMKKGMTVNKKLEIFDKVNAGEVRVVMGSTFTLGTGVNIQERLHTLIHLDAPNRPMDYTQRNGRILRQGNLHNTWGLPVRVLRFGVEDSLDVTAYQRLKTKGAIADSIMNGKQLMANSMENRTLEEDQDLFGDITAQLSGSEYAMLKNQIEKEVRKLRAAEKNWKADQTYIHNRKRQIAGQNREAEKRIADNKSYLEKVEAATIGDITVGRLSFPSVDGMEDFFTEQNKKKAAMQEEVRTSGYSSRPATSDITISVGGFDFKIHTEITKEMKHQQGDLFATAPAKMTYSCPELGIDAMPVRGNAIKNAVLDIMENVVSGKDFRERIAHAENYLERNNAEFEAISKRDGLPFKDAEALEKAEEKLAEYEELMKAEMAAKEAKYAEMDKEVEAASGIELTEEDSEPTASEPVSEYSAENANFVSRYETQDGKTVRYTSENPEAYGGLFDFDFSNDVPGAGNAAEGGRVNRRQQSNPPLQRRNAALLDTNASARLNEANGEYCALERKFRESNYMEFTSAEKVESADDVAFIFEELENASVENVFVVMTKRGVPTVMHISIGGFNWSAMNAGPVKLAYDRIKPDKVYFVHNHPSGALNCSPQDVNCLKQIEGAIGKKSEGVIMDLKSGKYGTFDSSGTGSSASHDKAPAPAAQRRLRLYAFDRHVFNPDYQPSEKMGNAQDVAKFLSSHRLGDRSKVSVLVCNNQNQIVANIHTTHVSIDSKGLADDIVRAIGEFGGMHAFLYGDFEQSGMVAYRNLTQAVKERSGGVYNLLDVVRIEGNHTWSARDNGYVYEPGSEYGASPEGDIRFREVKDDAVLKEFAEGKTVKAYRTMQVIDGKLYSPMATKVGGKATPEIKLGVPEQAEEHPEIIKRTKVGRDGVEVGYVVIDKGLGKGTLDVAYNPSIHASLTPLNDQFTSADIRPNLVIVETLIPKSELTSGYRAPMAKDAVGEMSWHSGTVSGKLAELGKPRRVILSRYDMPVRIVPFKEVAQMIAAQLEGTDIDIPYNVVTPQVRMELQHLGIAISDTPSGSVGESRDFGKAEYITDQEIERINAHQQEMAQTSPEAKSSHAEKLAKKFNTPIQVVADAKELTSNNAERQARMRRSKGFYDTATGKVVVVLPNNTNVEDVAETVFHEVVAHKGLREMLGDENYDAFCDEVYDHLKDDLKEEVDRETTRRFEREPEKGYEHARRVSVDELFGRMAEKGFEDFTKAERGIWAKLKAKVLEAINKFLGSLRLPKWVKLGDNELRYMLWRSHEKLRTKGDYVDIARDAAKREELGVNKSDVIVARTKKTTADRIEETFDAAVAGDLKGKPVEIGRLTKEGHEYLEKLSGIKMKEEVSFVLNPSDMVHMYRDHFGENEKDKGNNIPLTKEDIRAIARVVSNPERVIFGKEPDGLKRNLFYFLAPADEGAYNLLEIYGDRKGNLTAKTYYKTRKGVSQRALSLKKSEHLTSVTDGATLSDAAKLPKFFDTTTNSDGESYDFRYRDGETEDIWKDRSVGLEERITNAAIRLSNNQSGDLTLRNDAQKAVVNNLQSLLHSMRNRRGTAQSFTGADRKVEAGVVGAMNAQSMFDRATVKRVSDLARILMQNGYLSGMTSGEMQRLLSAVKNATAMHDIADSVQKIMDIMVNNQLRNAEGALRQLLSIRGSKVDARGVEVQGVLDVEGQRTMEVVKKAMSLSEDDITDRIAEALNRMGDPDQTISDQAALEYAGLNMALDYVQNIAGSKAEEKTLRDSLKTAKEDRDAGRMTDDAYKQFVEATEDAIRKNKVERAEAYFNLVGRLSDSLRESIENAKAFREAEKARVSEIHHNANSDMEGRPCNEHHKDGWKDKLVNNGFVQFLFAPLGTFDQILRVFGNKSANGEGYLWNRFMRGWVDCRNKELTGVKEKFARLDEKAAELFGKGKTWGNLIRMEANMPKATVSFWDGGEMRDHELTQGNLLYIYMVDKMTDGRMKLRRMGITEDDITRIENFLDPRFKALGDWLQDEFLVETRNEYNETHKRMFGASMAAIENYFPLKILANARVDKEEDVNQQNRPDGITTKTGSIIKRRVNNLALDITGADALSVILDHITQMEHWSAYAEWNRDLNTLRTYKRFRNQVINMTTVYGGGRKLWENFNDLCLMAAGEYRPPVSKLNKSAVNLAKGVTAAKVSFRMYTALKQLLSAPAYAPEVGLGSILKSIANPYGDFKWCLENMPIFRERWHSRISGDPRLLKSDMDWKMWRSRIMEISSRIGMTPNAFVDAVTVSIGARALYETRLKQYLKEGYPTDAAEKRAMQDATILFNQTQQSSESPFLSTMQVDKDWLSTLFTVFRNSAMSYTRQEFDAMRNLKRNLTPGQRAKRIEFMTKQILRDWDVDPDTATDAERDQAQGSAKKRFRRQIKKDVLRLATFGFILELAWNLGPYLPYIFFGNDEDEKDKMWDDAFTHAYFGSVEGLTGGDVISSFGNMWASGEWNWNQLSKDMPLASDINTIGSKFVGGKNAEAINDILNLLVQMGVGMNPQSLTDTAIAITDACGDDPALSHEAAIFAMRVLQVPQSQIDKMYFDEVDLTGEEASKLTPAQLAQRYAEYKVKRGTPLAPWSWGDEERLGKYNDLATDRMKERLDAQGDAKVIEAYTDFEARYKAVSEKVKEAKALMKTDYSAAAQAHAMLQSDPDFGLYQRFGALDKQLGRISKMWLTSKTPEESSLVASTITSYRAGMVKVLQAETAESQQSAMSELTTLMNDFYAKYQGMQR